MNYHTTTKRVGTQSCVALAGALVLTFVLGIPPSSAQSSTSPGKNTAFFSTELPVVLSFSNHRETFSVTITEGKPKRVLTLVASLEIASSQVIDDGYSLSLRATANGVRMTGGRSALGSSYFESWAVESGDGLPVTVGGVRVITATWWLDLDEAEAANPGLFKRQPLGVVLEVVAGGFTLAIDTWVTMSARMEKK